jgi:DNA invertase Pin-like site-specific DNA recombinase
VAGLLAIRGLPVSNRAAVTAASPAGSAAHQGYLADTTMPHGQLMLTILSGLAEFERTLIRARTGEGRERAEARATPSRQRTKCSSISAAPAATLIPVRWRPSLNNRAGAIRRLAQGVRGAPGHDR